MSNSPLHEEEEEPIGPEGCYLIYEPDSGGKLMLFYSKGIIPDNAVGFFLPGENSKGIQGFKFKQNGGRSELIKGIAGGDSNRRKYFSGWCQFIKIASQYNGKVIKFPIINNNNTNDQDVNNINNNNNNTLLDSDTNKGVEVDCYGFIENRLQPYLLELDDGLVDITPFDAIAVLPKHKEFLLGVKSISLATFLDKGNIGGSTTNLF